MMTRKSMVLVMLPMLAWVACSDSSDSATTTSTGSTSAGTGGEAASGGGGAAAETVGSGGSGGAGGSAETCGDAPIYGAQGSMNTAECTACVDEACCDERAACGEDPECLAFRDCAAACSVLDPQCQDDCKAMAPNGVAPSSAFAGCRQNNCAEECANLACFGNQVWPDPSVTDYTIVISVQDFSSAAPVAGAEVKICDTSDAYCAAPLATHTSDAEGKVTATFPAVAAGFGAFIELNAAGFVPGMHYFTVANPGKDASLNRGVAVVPTSLLDTLASFAGITLDPTRGHLIVTARDCGDAGLINATMSADTQDAQSTLVYLIGGLPDTQAAGTDRYGRVNLINIPEGPAVVTTTHVTTASAYSKMAVNIRPGYLTSFAAVPTP